MKRSLSIGGGPIYIPTFAINFPRFFGRAGFPTISASVLGPGHDDITYDTLALNDLVTNSDDGAPPSLHFCNFEFVSLASEAGANSALIMTT